ncbi:iron export ABC transporter permease subunit FetB [Solemya pervernicosa gill symbiont]|uniref:Iron export ABC transporter permease subunit FetB n=2 Tax=Gammaproteobacteria incertae sedis TaxID=118884 RepID=A0A1T2L382_9GAMM|nr:iron export ABC transporter permease subunit FetB [Candidatus Reidiella endopervernicosa]OOZ39567.1 iron export ABC transporter permease subunit FetB [Solemya pervernicosa gill symbiont]QKQ25659.1 iron export ABC transporter permease subunit FetB [Candidatus Reidiella endopervernicosa]
MNIISLTPFDLALAALLVLLLAFISSKMALDIAPRLLIAALRTTLQLALIGVVLKALFANVNLLWIALIASAMLIMAGREVGARQHRRFVGWWGYGVGTLSMFISSFSVTLLALTVIIGNDPWYQPQYAIPLLGMLLGNTMNGISLGMDRLTTDAWRQRAVIESRLMLGESWCDAIATIRRDALRVGMIPMINAMAAAGVVSLPGMMTGQILAGAPPMEAVKYQILIMFLITAGTGFGTLTAVWLGARRLFDDRHRLRLERLTHKEEH